MSDTAPPPPAVASHVIFLFDSRALFETGDLDNVNRTAWHETLDSFGYQDLDSATYIHDLAQRTSGDVMMALCPFTTRHEWEPALNKRDMRLQRDVADMCYANLVPIPGVLDFLAAAGHSVGEGTLLRVAFLSPFGAEVTGAILEASQTKSAVDMALCYSTLEAGPLEALDRFGVLSADGIAARVVAFASTVPAARAFRRAGVDLVVGVEHNNRDQESDDGTAATRPVVQGFDDAEALLSAGCRCVVPNFAGLAWSHLATM